MRWERMCEELLAVCSFSPARISENSEAIDARVQQRTKQTAQGKGQHVVATSAKQEEKLFFIFSPARISENSEAIGARVLQNEKDKADVVCTNGSRRQTQV